MRTPAASGPVPPPPQPVADPPPPSLGPGRVDLSSAAGPGVARGFSSPAAAPRLARASLRSSSVRGQASVELVVLLPLVLAVLAVGYQAVLAGQAVWEARVAARAAARAHAFGGDPAAAARGHLRRALERGLRVTAGENGDVRVSVRVPSVLPALRLGRVSATSHFQPQNG